MVRSRRIHQCITSGLLSCALVAAVLVPTPAALAKEFEASAGYTLLERLGFAEVEGEEPGWTAPEASAIGEDYALSRVSIDKVELGISDRLTVDYELALNEHASAIYIGFAVIEQDEDGRETFSDVALAQCASTESSITYQIGSDVEAGVYQLAYVMVIGQDDVYTFVDAGYAKAKGYKGDTESVIGDFSELRFEVSEKAAHTSASFVSADASGTYHYGDTFEVAYSFDDTDDVCEIIPLFARVVDGEDVSRENLIIPQPVENTDGVATYTIDGSCQGGTYVLAGFSITYTDGSVEVLLDEAYGDEDCDGIISVGEGTIVVEVEPDEHPTTLEDVSINNSVFFAGQEIVIDHRAQDEDGIADVSVQLVRWPLVSSDDLAENLRFLSKQEASTIRQTRYVVDGSDEIGELRVGFVSVTDEAGYKTIFVDEEIAAAFGDLIGDEGTYVPFDFSALTFEINEEVVTEAAETGENASSEAEEDKEETRPKSKSKHEDKGEDYMVISGDQGLFSWRNLEGLSIVFSGNRRDLSWVDIDGNPVNDSKLYYTVTSPDTSLSLTHHLLSILPPGSHLVTVHYDDGGTADATIHVCEPGNPLLLHPSFSVNTEPTSIEATDDGAGHVEATSSSRLSKWDASQEEAPKASSAASSGQPVAGSVTENIVTRVISSLSENENDGEDERTVTSSSAHASRSSSAVVKATTPTPVTADPTSPTSVLATMASGLAALAIARFASRRKRSV